MTYLLITIQIISRAFQVPDFISKENKYYKNVKISFMILLLKTAILLFLSESGWHYFFRDYIFEELISVIYIGIFINFGNLFELFLNIYISFLALWIIVLFFKWLFQKGILGSSQITLSSEEASSVLVGMLKSQKSINITDIAETTGMPETHWKTRIYQLIGDDKISGEFDGMTFTPSEDENISDLIDHLMGQYEKMEEGKVGKIE
ncbi:MAG: hypothetical protein INQ03_24960 [Candidatus Heimdallarchaeota archaeon]|nr:hypothetical protein [Candidatus Heimdallarchaeota archaeon]